MDFVKALLGVRLINDEVERAVKSRVRQQEDFEVSIEDELTELLLDRSRWTPAGEVQLAPAGSITLPRLPSAPGIRRIDFIASDAKPGDPSPVAFAQSQDLHSDFSIETPDDQAIVDEDYRPHLEDGAQVLVSHIDHLTIGSKEADLSDPSIRAQVMEVLRTLGAKLG